MSFWLPFTNAFARALRWPLWGVLVSGTASSLLWEHGADLFSGHPAWLLLFLIGLPIIGGILTPDRPTYTIVIFAIGSFPPLSDIPPYPIGLWLLNCIRGVLSRDPYTTAWESLFIQLPIGLGLCTLALAMMSLAFAPLVYLGWCVRRKCGWYRRFRQCPVSTPSPATRYTQHP